MDHVQYDRIAARYQYARGMTADALAPWREALAPWLGALGARRILDAGAGTGQFASMFADWFASPVIALEPSAGMRREARRTHPHQLIRWIGGRAEALPLAARSCGAAWLSTVVHHVADLGACAHELRRVLESAAPVLVRSAFPGRDAGITLLRFFPQARRRLAQFPSVEQVGEEFARAGFALIDVREVPQTSALSLRDFRARVFSARRADSLLAVLDDVEFTHGMMALDDAVRAEPELDPQPVVDRLTLLVMR